MRRGFAFLRRHLRTTLRVITLLAVVCAFWLFQEELSTATSFLLWNLSAWSPNIIAALLNNLWLVGGLGLGLVLLALWGLPKWQAARPGLTPQAQFEVENEARKTLAEILGGAAVLVGLLFTWENLGATQENLRITQETATKSQELTREGQITERFTRAVDQPGSDRVEVRLGGIYALERIARDSARDHWPIMEILTAYIRNRAPRPPKDSQPPQDDHLLPELPPDIQAVLTVLRRRTQAYGRGEDQPLDLAETNLRQAHLEGANLKGASLQGANLQRARLVGVNLERANLIGANLQRAGLGGAVLKGAGLGKANLEGAYLAAANLESTDLRDANLKRATLEAYLKGRTL